MTDVPFRVSPLGAGRLETLDDVLSTQRVPVSYPALAAEWPATRRWTFSHLAEALRGAQLTVYANENQIYPARRADFADDYVAPGFVHPEFRTLDADSFFASPSPSNIGLYLYATPIADHPQLLADIAPPSAQTPLVPLLWVSRAGQTTPTHFDGTNNLFVQITGHKRMLLFPPDAFSALSVFGVDHVYARHSRWFDFSRLDAAARARLAEVTAFEVELGAGDAVYIPNFWWHAVFTQTDSVSVSFASNMRPFPRYEELMEYWASLRHLFEEAMPDDVPLAMKHYFLRALL